MERKYLRQPYIDEMNVRKEQICRKLKIRKVYTDKSFIDEIKRRREKFHNGQGERIKHSEYLMLWMNTLLTSHPYILNGGVMYRMKKRYGEDTTFEQAVEWLDRDIRQAEAEGN